MLQGHLILGQTLSNTLKPAMGKATSSLATWSLYKGCEDLVHPKSGGTIPLLACASCLRQPGPGAHGVSPGCTRAVLRCWPCDSQGAGTPTRSYVGCRRCGLWSDSPYRMPSGD